MREAAGRRWRRPRAPRTDAVSPVSVPSALPRTTLETLKHRISPSAGESCPGAVDVLLYTPGTGSARSAESRRLATAGLLRPGLRCLSPGHLDPAEKVGDAHPKLWCALSEGRVVVFDASSWTVHQQRLRVGTATLVSPRSPRGRPVAPWGARATATAADACSDPPDTDIQGGFRTGGLSAASGGFSRPRTHLRTSFKFHSSDKVPTGARALKGAIPGTFQTSGVPRWRCCPVGPPSNLVTPGHLYNPTLLFRGF